MKCLNVPIQVAFNLKKKDLISIASFETFRKATREYCAINLISFLSHLAFTFKSFRAVGKKKVLENLSTAFLLLFSAIYAKLSYSILFFLRFCVYFFFFNFQLIVKSDHDNFIDIPRTGRQHGRKKASWKNIWNGSEHWSVCDLRSVFTLMGWKVTLLLEFGMNAFAWNWKMLDAFTLDSSGERVALDGKRMIFCYLLNRS